MRPSFILLAGVCLSINSSLLGAADKTKADFDQGIDARTLLNRARQVAHGDRRGIPGKSFSLEPTLDPGKLPPHMERMAEREIAPPDQTLAPGELRPCQSYVPEDDETASSIMGKSRLDEAGCTLEDRSRVIWGDRKHRPFTISADEPSTRGDAYEGMARDRQSYKDSEIWLEKVQKLPRAQRPPFESQHQKLSATRINLMSDGRALDRAEEQLVQRGNVLIRWRARIDARSRLIETDRNEFDASCRNNPFPPIETCNEWFDRANACIVRHNDSVRRYKSTNAAYTTDRNQHFAKVDAFKKSVSAWDAQEVVPFNKAVEQALIDNPAGTCNPDNWEELVKKKDAECGSGPVECNEGDHCADLGTSIVANGRCYDAAKELNACFGQNHPDHSKTMAAALAAKDNCTAILAAKCGRWDPVLGRCDPIEHERLQDHVRAVCGIQSSCDQVPFKECDILRDYHQRNLICRDAQDEINEVCYAGGDRGHREKRDNAQKAADKCFERIRDDQCSVPVPVRPIR